MAAGDEAESKPASEGSFGSCCESLRDALAASEFEPLITVDGAGVLMLGVGLVDLEEGEQGIVDHAMFFCPFCGTRLQTPEDVKAKSEAAD